MKRSILIFVLLLVLVGCSAFGPRFTPTPTITPMPTITPVPTDTPTPIPTATPTLVPITDLDLSNLLVQANDLPAGYSGAQIGNPKFEKYN